MNTLINLNNLRIYAFHGVGQQEQIVGNEYMVNLRLKVDFSQAMRTDDLHHTVSYADVADCVKDEMSRPSLLIEHAAGRIIKRLFADFESIEEIRIKLDKRNPPMGADIESAGVEVEAKRGEAL